MAKKTQTKPDQSTSAVVITRHIPGPPRRATGDVLRLTPQQIQQQGLTRADYTRLQAKR